MDTLKRYWSNLSLGSKFASLTSLLVVIAVFALTYLSIARERASFQQELENQAELLLDTTALTLRDQLYRVELDELVDVAKVVSSNSNVTTFIVYDSQGIVLVDSSIAGLQFSRIVDPLGQALIGLGSEKTYLDWQW